MKAFVCCMICFACGIVTGLTIQREEPKPSEMREHSELRMQIHLPELRSIYSVEQLNK